MDKTSENTGVVVAAFIGIVIAAVQWLLGREVRRRDSDIVALKLKNDDHEARIRAMEIDRVKMEHIIEIHRHLDRMRERAEERHIELLDRIRE